ncbi:U4/U6 small nuclear ribonucleoprotein prp4 [Spiromyces aspiralis]|uniref:U4/U6 small nuclear ribonucleoprotein prp4 n=1 Tax=Spiromyces aspiralis TaxID=68401 RepID=A0ACC1HLL0_9FUNG|nr:U4/U6 small nuclear ribonucleoprotein prp4 [Spiromyces aspiralis]
MGIDMWSVGVTLYELYTGQIMFPGRTNNQMLKLIMEAKGRIPNRTIKRGQFWQQHFEDLGGGNMTFLSHEVDSLSKKEVVKKITYTRPVNDIKSMLLSATPTGVSQKERGQVILLADLLEKCLEVNPERRVKPKQALSHKFFME